MCGLCIGWVRVSAVNGWAWFCNGWRGWAWMGLGVGDVGGCGWVWVGVGWVWLGVVGHASALGVWG